jgi:serine/threonine protein kinase
MDANRWNRVDELLGAALDLEPEARPGFLAGHCGDDDGLRLEVEKLLAAYEQADRFIETSALHVAARAVAGETVLARARQQVGPYKIISMLGAGGMGEVFLAEDTRLSRRVALKVLPFPFTSDRDRVRRFETEARAASALNHPNIIIIYDIGQVDSIHYIASEYVDGDTLRERLKQGPVKLPAAIRLVLQVAEALSAAHSAGITHRDIKPENIVVRNDHQVKVLDFGLAKLANNPVGQTDSVAPSLQTQGVLVGTIKYMSPEQALGRKVDARSDLWSLGVLLYELISGEPPFSGETQASTFDAILNRTPEPLTSLNENLPPSIDPIITKALEKDADLRYQSAADMRADLLRLQRELEPASSKLDRSASRSRYTKSRSRTWQFVAAGLTAAFLLAILGWFFFVRQRPVVRPSGPNWTSARAMQLTNDAGPEYFPSLAPDGKSLIYASRISGNWDIYWQRVGGKNTVNLTKDTTEDDTQPVYSPDGTNIAFRSERNPRGIYVMEATSENVKRVSEMGFNPSWSPDGRKVVVGLDRFNSPTIRSLIPSALVVIDIQTGAKRTLTDGDAVQPSWSPNGYRIAYWGMHPGGGKRDIWTIPSDGGPAVAVTGDDALDWNPVWSPDGRYLYFASNRGGSMNFWRVAIDEKSGQVTGEPENVTTPSAYSQHLSFSRDGKRMAYVQQAETQSLQKIALDPLRGRTSGDLVAVVEGTKYATNVDVSPDGEWLAYSSQGESREDIFVVKKDGTHLRQLLNDTFNDRFPRWSPDGSRLAFYSDRSGRYEVWIINVDGTGLHQVTFTSGSSAVYPVWSPDGKQMIFKQRDHLPFIVDLTKPWQEQTLWQFPAEVPPKENYWIWSWSHDGKKVAGWWTSKLTSASAVQTFTFETKRYDQLTTFGNNPIWLHDDRRIIFHSDGRLYIVDSLTKKIQDLLNPSPREARSPSLAPDDRTLYYTLVRTEADIWLLNLDDVKPSP